MKQHKRGGAYNLRIMSDVTNWGGTILDREILNHLQKGDMVRIIIDSYKNKPYFSSRYVRITNVLPNGYFKAIIEDSYNTYYCDYCDKEGTKGNYLYCCERDCCNFDCHLDCYKKHPEIKYCNCEIFKRPFQNGESIILKKNNISEIPNWSPNTRKLIAIYENNENRGYMFTGFR